jgi:glycosyltransferase involved in cell wall biosynthesis
VRQELLAARALVLPSFAEGLPVAIMEAMALGRPVISTYTAGIPELVEPGVNGWLVPAGAIEPLADAMAKALTADQVELERMGRAGAARIAERHNSLTEAGELLKLFRQQDLLGGELKSSSMSTSLADRCREQHELGPPAYVIK